MSDERRLARWSRRILNQGEARRLARSLSGWTRTAAVRSPSTTWRSWTSSRRCWARSCRPKRKREADPLDHLSGLEELMPQREETQWERAERLAAERTEYAHVIVDEAQDLTPMQWRMVGRRGRHATWTIVGDPAHLLVRPGRGGRGPGRGARLPAAPPLHPHGQLPQPGRDRGAGGEGAGARHARHGVPVGRPFDRGGAALRPGGGGGDLAATVREEARRLLAEVDGTVGVVVAMNRRAQAREWLAELGERVVALGSLEAKGLEYDATVVVSPAEIAGTSPRRGCGCCTWR
ncbi:DNA helicase OS=Streptomyces microflavus OX=1919 GN=Smic_28470 PE=4 SV=1 [Streptomyces microflavus]